MNNNFLVEGWAGIVLQWLLLFGLLSIPIIPGWLLGRLAKRNNRNRWVFFIIGIVIFVTGFVVGVRIDFFLLQFVERQEGGSLVFGLLRFIVAMLFSVASYFILKRNWTKMPYRD